VDELANALVARPGKPEAIGLGAEAPANLRDRQVRVVEPRDRVDEPWRKPRRRSDHDASMNLQK